MIVWNAIDEDGIYLAKPVRYDILAQHNFFPAPTLLVS
jgi:hypothetical protein